jgi:prepilin-type N-terminal cleavage/methylation domain-containing protein
MNQKSKIKNCGSRIDKQNSRFQILDSRSGFTVMELLVAIALFSVVISIAVGGIIISLRSQRELSSLIAADNDVSLALEQMAREVRTGFNFCRGATPCASTIAAGSCGLGIVSSGVSPEIDFTNADTNSISYTLAAGTIERSESGVAKPITGSNAAVKSLQFSMFGTSSADCWPARVTISVVFTSKDLLFQDVLIHLQTTITSRQLDS